MKFYLVKFLEDGIYHICLESKVIFTPDEPNVVSANYKGIYFKAVVIGDGDKDKMLELKERCETNDLVTTKFSLKSPKKTSTSSIMQISPLSSLHQLSTTPYSPVNRQLFPTTSSACTPSTEHDESETVTLASSPLLNPCKRPSKELQSSSSSESEATIHDSPDVVSQTDVGDNIVTEDQDQRTATKKHYCPYCRNLYSKLGRHLFQVHIGEQEIQAIKALPPNHKERKRVIACIRAKGAKIYNKVNPSDPILTRNKQIFKKDNYISCHLCGNLYKVRFFHRHVKICPSKREVNFGGLRVARAEAAKAKNEQEHPIQLHRDVLTGMKDTEVKDTVENDELLTVVGNYLCEMYSLDKHLINLIRRKLRQLVEIKIEITKLDNEITTFSEIFQPKKINVLFKAIKSTTGFNKGVFSKPSKAVDLSPLLQLCAQRMINNAAVEENEEVLKHVGRWMEIFKSDYNVLISKKARRNRDEKKWNRTRKLPLTDDMIKLNKEVAKTIEKARKTLTKGFNFLHWSNLNKATMVQILTFNRKRVGDVEKMRLNDFNRIHNVDKRSDTYKMLSESEKVVCSQYMRVEVQGKHAKPMPILLNNSMIQNIRTIIALRDEAQIPKENEFVFAKKKDEYFIASLALRDFAYGCGAEEPSLLTGTKMRKHIATITQAFNFSENDLSVLASYLGHSLETHRQFYRLPDEALQLARISKVLAAVDQGKVEELKGKTLNEIETVLETIHLDPAVGIGETYVECPVENLPESTGGPSPVKKRRVGPHRSPQKTIARQTWSTPEKRVMRSVFSEHLTNWTLPLPFECHEAKRLNSPLKNRTVNQIKAWVFNENNRRKKHRSNNN